MKQLGARRIILFDGVCNLCNGVVHFVLAHDDQQVFYFASLQSKAGQGLLHQHQLPTDRFDSFVLVQGDMVWQRSEAGLEVVRHLGLPWSLLMVCRLLPCSWRDAIYDWVARNRYRWFGKKQECLLPTLQMQARFLPEPNPGKQEK